MALKQKDKLRALGAVATIGLAVLTRDAAPNENGEDGSDLATTLDALFPKTIPIVAASGCTPTDIHAMIENLLKGRLPLP